MLSGNGGQATLHDRKWTHHRQVQPQRAPPKRQNAKPKTQAQHMQGAHQGGSARARAALSHARSRKRSKRVVGVEVVVVVVARAARSVEPVKLVA
eukprot:3807989-Prymnesium_polylepis.1